MNTIAEIAGVIKKLKSAVIFTHVQPDGDTIGGAMALSIALQRLGIQSEVVNEGKVPKKLCFLEGADKISNRPSLDGEGYICIDASDTPRLGELQKLFTAGARKGKPTVNIDHHVSNTRYCRYNFVRPRASNCENVAELIRELGVEEDKPIADYLLMGMVTDSGGFSHRDVNGDTFRAAATAMDGGADVERITYETFKKQSKARAGMYASVISNLRYFLNDALAVALVSREALESRGLTQEATDGIVDFALSIDTVEVSVCLMEVKAGQYKASLRSKSRVNVNEVARSFGGGGHVFASGCMFFGEIEEVYDRLQYAVAQAGNL